MAPSTCSCGKSCCSRRRRSSTTPTAQAPPCSALPARASRRDSAARAPATRRARSASSSSPARRRLTSPTCQAGTSAGALGLLWGRRGVPPPAQRTSPSPPAGQPAIKRSQPDARVAPAHGPTTAAAAATASHRWQRGRPVAVRACPHDGIAAHARRFELGPHAHAVPVQHPRAACSGRAASRAACGNRAAPLCSTRAASQHRSGRDPADGSPFRLAVRYGRRCTAARRFRSPHPRGSTPWAPGAAAACGRPRRR